MKWIRVLIDLIKIFGKIDQLTIVILVLIGYTEINKLKKRGIMMEFLKNLFSRQEKSQTGNPKPGNHTVYREGDKVKCEVCGESLKVKYHDPGRIVLITPDSLKGVALRCQSCGFIVCDPCSMSAGDLAVPICPKCKTKSGPYFFHA